MRPFVPSVIITVDGQKLAPTPLDLHNAKIKAQRQEHARKYLKPFMKGVPHGRPIGSRNKLQGMFLHALADDFARYGKGAIEHARRVDPMGYVKTIATLMPKQFEQTTPLEELSDAELSAAIEHLKSKLSIDSRTGTDAAQESDEADGLPALPEAAGIS